MDRQPDLAGGDAVEPDLAVDQAIFTSIRSVQGEGYRIVGASPGVRAAERREITRRSPSHDSLCEQSQSAVGLLAFPLETGRYCVGYSRYAGTEHTARGGSRVYTHMVVLERPAYRCLAYNPFRLCSALRVAAGDVPILEPRPQLDSLVLEVDADDVGQPSDGVAASGAAEVAAGACRVASSLLLGNRAIIVARDLALETLEWALMAVPVSVRQCVSVTAGLRFSPSRQVECTVVTTEELATRHAIRGHGIEWVDPQEDEAEEDSPYAPWLELMRRWFVAGRFADIHRVTQKLAVETDPSSLNRAASVCEGLDCISDEQGSGSGLSALEDANLGSAEDTAIGITGRRSSARQPEVDTDISEPFVSPIVKRAN